MASPNFRSLSTNPEFKNMGMYLKCITIGTVYTVLCFWRVGIAEENRHVLVVLTCVNAYLSFNLVTVSQQCRIVVGFLSSGVQKDGVFRVKSSQIPTSLSRLVNTVDSQLRLELEKPKSHYLRHCRICDRRGRRDWAAKIETLI